MSDTKDTGSKHGMGRTLSMKRPAVEQGRVRQNFSHGRSKTVAVEIKRKRTSVPGEPGKIESREPQTINLKPASPRVEPKRDESSLARSGMVLRTLTNDEKEARERALADARVREAEERKHADEDAKRRLQHDEVERREREAADARKADEEARHKSEAEAKRRAEETARKLEPRAPQQTEAEDEEARGRTKVKREVKLAPTRAKPDAERRRGKLTIANALQDGEEKGRSLAAFRRRTERQKKQAQGFQMPTEKRSREVTIPEAITIQELANRMAERAVDVIKLLMKQGEMRTINDIIDADTAQIITEEFGHTVKRVSESDVEEGLQGGQDTDENLTPRAPVVTIMGHVDHGKTSLLDALRKTNVVSGEAGGITQHIGAYQVETEGGPITFIDTPGHEAFTSMRARGAKVTDIVVLVVAADDGVMPQTIEAINHARAAEVPIIVAINKIDKQQANPTRVRQQLVERELVPEAWGGDTIVIDVAPPAGIGVDELLESILLVAEVEELAANPKSPARALVLESNLDQGRGPVVTALVERGTLRVGDPIVAGGAWGKVRAMFDENGQQVQEAGPSTPVEVLGLDDVPLAGDELRAAPDEKTARTVAEARSYRRRTASLKHPMGLAGGARLEDIFAMVQRGEVATLNLVVKADVQGSLEALTDSLRKLDQEHEEVRLSFVHRAVGGINESDINLASVSNATVIGFNVRPDRQARELADAEGVEMRLYEVIYQVLEDVQSALLGMLKPEFEEVVTGDAEVREVFSVPRVGKVAGCYVLNGTITRGSKVRFLREGVIIWKGSIQSLRRFKDDVREVNAGFECGIGLSDFQDLKQGDIIETYEEREVPRT